MKYLFEFCGIFNPGFIIIIGVVVIFFILYNTLSALNKAEKSTRSHNMSNYIKTTGRIIEYETKTEEKIIKQNGTTQKTIITRLLPVIEYKCDDEIKTITYKVPFYKQIEPNPGYEFAVYIEKNTKNPLIMYKDIYYLETRAALTTAYVISAIIGLITIAASILSFIANLS